MPKDKHKNTWVSRMKKNVRSVLKGPGHSPAGKKYAAKHKPKTLATKGVERRLRAAGLTEAEIKKLR